MIAAGSHNHVGVMRRLEAVTTDCVRSQAGSLLCHLADAAKDFQCLGGAGDFVDADDVDAFLGQHQ